MATQTKKSLASKYGIVLFPGFQSLDVFGPLDVLNVLSRTRPLSLSIIAEKLSPVSTLPDTPDTATIGQSIVPTHTFETAPDDIEVLIVPGGKGTRDLEATQRIVDFLKEAFPKVEYLLTVCTGSSLAARAGILDGHEATSNKGSFTWVTTQGPKVKWVHEARWVTSGNIWTSSGISAGIDMMYAFIASQDGEEVAARIAIASEYVRNTDPKYDPFAKYSG
ncbi:class I glutamine amidotransferase-like protein [Dactylonectria estremocensis]|uniref:Class I glutamine amidotransferase-like protein n=1 Tax=Dactylonectria estremocensis TaxID=1079267 RepID=A0A9P9ET86_9HYPO|nr:class I glutamine amidotransferase-like protein [Dactylonectria estremocensis]